MSTPTSHERRVAADHDVPLGGVALRVQRLSKTFPGTRALDEVSFEVAYVLERTPYGRLLRAVGSNAQASRLVGLGVDRIILSSFVLSGALSGAAGVVQLARSGSGDPSVGFSFTLPAIAAAFLGATSIRPGRFNVLGTLVAIAFLAATVSGLMISGIESWVQDVVNGAALLIGIAASAIIARQRGGRPDRLGPKLNNEVKRRTR